MSQSTCCIVGGGIAGLVTVKQCLEEGLKPVCFDKKDDIGGLWKYNKTSVPGQASLFNSVHLNTSKEMTCFSDFPFPKSYPNFMHHSYYKRYIDSYADAFNLREYIYQNTEVLSIKKVDVEKKDQWHVTWKNPNQTEVSCLFDCVVVCNGHNYLPIIPEFKGMSRFKGEIFHSHDFKELLDLDGKRIMIVGAGNSGSDIATALSRRAKQVYLSVRSGTYVTTRADRCQRPYDYKVYTRFRNSLPYFVNRYLQFNEVKHQAIYGLHPCKSFTPGIKTISDTILNEILHGHIKVKDNIRYISEETVVFEDGTEEQVDVIIAATGYSYETPFLRDTSVTTKDGLPNLYKMIFPTDSDQVSLAVVGRINAGGSRPCTIEMQARWVAKVFSKKSSLPCAEVRKDWVLQRNRSFGDTDQANAKSLLRIDYINYMNDIASLIGCKPNPLRYILSDFRLSYKLVFGPLTPPQWRLQGPGCWSGARAQIFNVDENTCYPLKARNINVLSKRKYKFADWNFKWAMNLAKKIRLMRLMR